jgi:hypothetical protein
LVESWKAGRAILIITKDHKVNREWCKYQAEKHIARSRDHHAARIAIHFKSEKGADGLTAAVGRSKASAAIRQAHEAKRLAIGESPRSPKPVRYLKSVEITPTNVVEVLGQALRLVELASAAVIKEADPESVRLLAARLQDGLIDLVTSARTPKWATTRKPASTKSARKADAAK